MADLSETFKRLEQDPQGGSQHLLQMLETFLMPLLLRLDEVLDKRLVRTLVQCLVAIIRLRNNPQALWLSELGSYLDGYDGYAASAAAGTKRVGKLLRSIKWTVGLIDRYLLEKADEEVKKLKEQGKRILCIWDGSVVEKAESEKLEGLCPVLSSKAKRRSRTKRGVIFNWPAARPSTTAPLSMWNGFWCALTSSALGIGIRPLKPPSFTSRLIAGTVVLGE